MFQGFTLDEVDVGEVVLRVRHGGQGPPVVLLHGHPRTHATWHRVAPLLAPRHTVVCPDLRGYGGSTHRPTSPTTAVLQARDGRRYRGGDANARSRAIRVVGHDRGALVALRAALDHPDAVDHS